MSRCSPEIPNISKVYKGLWFVSITLFFLSLQSSSEDINPKGNNSYQKVTGEDPEGDRDHWDKIFSQRKYVFGKEPAQFLKDNVGKLPLGFALDIAMGEGRNAVYLAKKGFHVDGVDISEMALKKGKLLARENHVTINTISADLNHYVIKPESYDVILDFYYLQRNLVPQIKKGLKKGGVVIFENYTVEQLKNTQAQQLPKDYLLEKDEMKELFKDLKILLYRETNDGKSALASLIAQKP